MIEAYSSETLTLGLTWDTPDASTTWKVGYLTSLALDKARYIEHVMNTLERMLEEGDIPRERISVVRTLIEYLANYIDNGNDVRYFECLLSKISSGLHQGCQTHAAHLSECYEQNG
jgi:hypothetical protein